MKQPAARPTSKSRSGKKRLSPRTKVWLEIDGEYVFGLGICEMLEAVERTGSIKQAAAELDKSYRYVWGRIKAAEEALAQSLVRTQVGGQGAQRSHLTPLAAQLIQSYRTFRQRVFEIAAAEFKRLFGRVDA